VVIGKHHFSSSCNTCIPRIGQATSGQADHLPEADETFLIFLVEHIHCWTDKEPAGSFST